MEYILPVCPPVVSLTTPNSCSVRIRRGESGDQHGWLQCKPFIFAFPEDFTCISWLDRHNLYQILFINPFNPKDTENQYVCKEKIINHLNFQTFQISKFNSCKDNNQRQDLTGITESKQRKENSQMCNSIKKWKTSGNFSLGLKTGRQWLTEQMKGISCYCHNRLVM